MSSVSELKYLTIQIRRLFDMMASLKSSSSEVGEDLESLCNLVTADLHEYDVLLNRYWKKKTEELIDEYNKDRNLVTNEAEFYSISELLEFDTEIQWNIQFERLWAIRAKGSDLDFIIEDYDDGDYSEGEE